MQHSITMVAAVLALALAALGCGDGGGATGSDADSDADADGDGDTDGDTDSDSDTDTDTDTDTDSDTDADSDADADGDTDGDAGTDTATEPDTDTGTGAFLLELPLVDEATTADDVEALGGTIAGGTFGSDGWTTTSRDDIIAIPLPPAIGAAHGRLEFSVKNFEWDLSDTYWESWILVSLDAEGAPFAPTATGAAGIQALYQGFNPDDLTKGYRPVGYFNLYDPGCASWEDCTGEARTASFWLTSDDTVFTLSHAWDGPLDQLTFVGAGTVNKTIDLTATAPGGAIAASQLYLLINACGGSDANPCGPWDGPADLKGGPIGVTYSDLTLELYVD